MGFWQGCEQFRQSSDQFRKSSDQVRQSCGKLRQHIDQLRQSPGKPWQRCKQYAWAAGVLAGALLLAAGAAQGQLAVIWKKAVMICLECIGIG